ncbi:leucine rich adaptor protein 1 [Pseudochaenichthys georgianus]|uniref:leucine rich adaptor protein 1 n=1 Tax=Pseudochaenichthys georgianus TaxID=52239 RepID=UPI00146D9B2B|nr:leucine rich adaptor protein 1 [Pseudochaenichthys georgianus]
MDEGTASETVPDLKDIEVKIGRKTPEGLLRWMREEASSHRGDAKLATAHDTSKETGRKSLDDKIRKLKLEMAHLRSVDVKILQQLLAVHEGIEAVKWLLEERSTLTSRCSSLTSSQYSLGEGPDTSWRGSWSSLQDPNDKLDNISIGSYLDTLADDMDEYCPSSSDSVICSTTPMVSEATAAGRTVGGPGATVTAPGSASGAVGVRTLVNENGTGVGNGKPAFPLTSSQAKPEGPKQDALVWTKASEIDKESPVSKANNQTQVIKANAVLEKPNVQTGSPTRPMRPSLNEKLGTNQSPKLKPYKNGTIDLDTCKMNGKMHLEYDSHWRWVQSQEDVTFL